MSTFEVLDEMVHALHESPDGGQGARVRRPWSGKRRRAKADRGLALSLRP
ncbi:hypothetical protein ACYOEI_40455 [Singulisphaera rosea]